ncbi:MAG: signal peptidase I [Proteobacteria bacterium]|nr:signal peptidase I [Pseudomonadota bacterium]
MHLRLHRLLVEYRSLLIFFGFMLVFRSAVADWMYVPSGSMNPTLIEGDRIVVDKDAYGLRIPFTTMRLTQGADPQRGDIVIFSSPEDGITLVKRVIGLPGDTVAMQNERLTINGVAVEYAPAQPAADADLPRATQALDHAYLHEDLPGKSHPIMLLPNRGADRSFGPVSVPAGQYLMLGDNRDNSKDSRYIGFVPRDAIVGRAFAVAWSLNPDRWYLPREDRFFKALR